MEKRLKCTGPMMAGRLITDKIVRIALGVQIWQKEGTGDP